MKILKPLFNTLAATTAMTFIFSPVAVANSYNNHTYSNSFSSNSSPISSNNFTRTPPTANVIASDSNRGLILNGSDTASFYYKAGLNNYNNGELDEAEKAFQAVLRADGLDKQALYYLTHISAQKGDKFKTEKYVKAFHGIK